MKISIENFKSIRKLHLFEIKPFMVLSGVNSAGKSSFVQLLLLLKQTLEKSSTDTVFSEVGSYYSIKDLNDLFYAKEPKNKIHFALSFNKSEFPDIKFPELGVGDYDIKVSIAFLQSAGKIIVSDFEVDIDYAENEKEYSLKLNIKDNGLYNVYADSDIYGKGLAFNEMSSSIGFEAFYPLSYKLTTTGQNDSGEKIEIIDKNLFTIDWLKAAINSLFNNISYIGPARIEPQEAYLIPESHNDVGISGQFASQILKGYSEKPVAFRKLQNKEGATEYLTAKEGLLSATKFWMCDIFNVAEDIYSEKEEDSYKVILINKNDLKVNIKHVGFGISQLLPIVVQGLIMEQGGILIVEQPEIHLHPKIQSLLYDFLYSLTLDGKKVVIETHSSHFITRMRRRIAEDESNEMDNRISLTFIEDNIFRTLEIDDYGTILNYYPKDFVEQPTEEMKAIVEAQIRKRSAND